MNRQRLATILVCPRCQASLGVPSDATPALALECPVCDAEFPLATAEMRELPMVRTASRGGARMPYTTPPGLELIEELNGGPIDPWRAATPDALPAEELAREELEPSFEQLNEAGEPDDTSEAPVDELLVDLPDAAELSGRGEAPKPFEDLSVELGDIDLQASAEVPSVSLKQPIEEQVHERISDVPRVKEVDDDFAIGADESAEGDDAADVDEHPQPQADTVPGDRGYDFSPYLRPQRRRSSPVRTLVGIVGGGVGGLLLAGYALTWLKGIDLFQMAKWLPARILPESVLLADARPAGDLSDVPERDELATDDVAEVGAPSDEAPAEEPATAETTGDDSPATSDTTLATGNIEVDPEVMPASDTQTAAPVDEPATSEESTTSEEPAASGAESAPAVPAPEVADPPQQEAGDSAPSTWPATPIVADLTAPQFYSVSQLADSVAAAKTAGRDFVSGNLADRDSVRPMGQAYMKLCAVAERYTLADPREYGAPLFTQQALAKQQFHIVAGNVARRGDLGVIASRWLQHPRRQNNGIVLAGRVSDMQPRGRWTEYTIDVPVGDAVLSTPVLLDYLRFTTGDEAGVVGVIVTDPQRRITGYTGEAPQVVVSGYHFDPAEFAEENSGVTPEFDIEGFLNGN